MNNPLTASETKQKYAFATILLAASMFCTGMCGLVFEYILSTVSTYILGNSIEQFSITIALMLFMMGVAGVVQKKMTDDRLIEKFIFVEATIAVLGGFAPIAIYAAFGTMQDHFNLIQYFFICAIGFLIGFEIPLVLRINEKFSETLKINLSYIYGADYLGSFFGALIWVYFFLKYVPLTETGFILGSINLAIATVTFLYFARHKLVEKKTKSFAIIGIAFTAIIFGYANSQMWDASLEQKLYEDKIVFATTTKYQRLVMTENPILNEYRFYINGNLQFSSLDENIYHEELIHPIMNLIQDHGNVLILGGGDGMALREILKYDDVQNVTLVDLDPDMTTFCANDPTLRKLNHDAFRDARVKIMKSGAVKSEGQRSLYQETGEHDELGNNITHRISSVSILNLDADKFINEIKEKWNVIVVDLPDSNSVELSKLYSKEFYLKLNRILAEKGMIVVQSTSPYHAKEAYTNILRTIEAAGYNTKPYHENVPSFGDWGWILAWKETGFTPEDMNDKIKNLSIQVETTHLTPDVFRAATVFGKGLLESNNTEISTLMNPTILEKYTNKSWIIE